MKLPYRIERIKSLLEPEYVFRNSRYKVRRACRKGRIWLQVLHVEENKTVDNLIQLLKKKESYLSISVQQLPYIPSDRKTVIIEILEQTSDILQYMVVTDEHILEFNSILLAENIIERDIRRRPRFVVEGDVETGDVIYATNWRLE